MRMQSISEDEKANHMIGLLNLNNAYLQGARNKARGACRKQLQNPGRKDRVRRALANRQFAFCSFLQAAFL